MGDAIILLTKNIIVGALSVVQSLDLPLDLIAAFAEYTGYGVWFVGGDLCLKIAASIVFWIGLKLSLGLILFILRLIK